MTEETRDSVKSRAQRPAIMCLNIGTPNTINFPFVTNGKLMVLGFSILSHIRVGTRALIESLQWLSFESQ